jgi:hypothetical protein
MSYTDGIPSPEIFRLWTAISTIAGALERRVWVNTARKPLYPSLYVMLVAPPGVGKSMAIDNATALWRKTKVLRVSPNNMTKASLVDALAAADRKLLREGGLVEYHSMVVPVSELGVLIPKHEYDFLSVLNFVWDCPESYLETRRSLENDIDIVKPQMNILAGTQPAYLSALLPEEAWAMGFTARFIMIYSATSPKVDFFQNATADPKTLDALAGRLTLMTNLFGEFRWTDDAKTMFSAWFDAGFPPVPEHGKLSHYNPRRGIMAIKLAMISSASSGPELLITKPDVIRAQEWLLEAESLMPDIFRDMVQKSDTQTIGELHFFLWSLYIKDQKPLHESVLFHFLQQRVPGEKIERILEVAVRANILDREAGGKFYVPRPRDGFGIDAPGTAL